MKTYSRWGWLVAAAIGCGPEPPGTSATETTAATSGSTGPETTTETSTSSTTEAPTSSTGPEAECVPAGPGVLPALLLPSSVLVVRPGSVMCGDVNQGCDCIAEDIDRLHIQLPQPLEPGLYEFLADDPRVTHTACWQGDDGCSQTGPAGTVRIISVSATCVTGEVNFDPTHEGAFAVAPC